MMKVNVPKRSDDQPSHRYLSYVILELIEIRFKYRGLIMWITGRFV